MLRMRTDDRFTGHVVTSRRGLSLGVVSVETSVSSTVTVDCAVSLAMFAWCRSGQRHGPSRLHATCH